MQQQYVYFSVIKSLFLNDKHLPRLAEASVLTATVNDTH